METLETINPFTLAPWEARMQTDVEATPQSPDVPGGSMQVATSSSARNELVGFGVAIEKQPPRYRKLKLKTLSVTLGARAEQNPFSAELAAMAHALNIVSGTERLQDYAAHEQQSGGSDAKESSTTVGPGIRLPTLQVDEKDYREMETRSISGGSQRAKTINC